MVEVVGKWKFGQLVWRFAGNGKVHFCHDTKLRQWVYRNFDYPWGHVDVIRKCHTDAYWQSLKACAYSKKALQYAQVFVDDGIIKPDKIELAAKNIQQIMRDIQYAAIEDAASVADVLGNQETAESIRGLTPPT